MNGFSGLSGLLPTGVIFHAALAGSVKLFYIRLPDFGFQMSDSGFRIINYQLPVTKLCLSDYSNV